MNSGLITVRAQITHHSPGSKVLDILELQISELLLFLLDFQTFLY